jgi:hypothetical protein
VGIEHHLLGLARVGPDEQHPAVAEPDMRHLHRRGHTVDQHDLMAPVELVGFAGFETQRHIRGRGRLLFFLGPRCRVTSDGIIPTVIPKRPELFENPDAGQSLALGLAGIRGQHLVERVFPGANLRLRLDGPLVGMLGHPRPDHLAHRVPRHPQIPADLLDALLLLKIRPPDLRDRHHNQHPTLCSPISSGASSTSV